MTFFSESVFSFKQNEQTLVDFCISLRKRCLKGYKLYSKNSNILFLFNWFPLFTRKGIRYQTQYKTHRSCTRHIFVYLYQIGRTEVVETNFALFQNKQNSGELLAAQSNSSHIKETLKIYHTQRGI